MNQLNSTWTLYFHKLYDTNWDISSYIKLYEIKDLEEYTIINNIIKPAHIENGMFFLMRNNIKPLWESDDNINGGSISFKIYKKFIHQAWNELTDLLIGEKILKNDEEYNNINGLSISPKKQFSIIKIWLKKSSINDTKFLNKMVNFNHNEAIYKSHKSN